MGCSQKSLVNNGAVLGDPRFKLHKKFDCAICWVGYVCKSLKGKPANSLIIRVT
jgi:hypothetical protein